MPLRADEPDPVREKLDEAKTLISSEKYEKALTPLTDAFDIAPSSKIMFNIAMCEKALNRHTDAVESFHRFQEMEAAHPSGNQVMLELAETALNELSSLVATLRIVEAPDGADVSIDGKSIGITPISKPQYLMPGNHTVTVLKSDFSPMEIDITAVGGATLTVRADLKSSLSRIFVTCSVQNGHISIDGERKGTCPYEGDLLPGTHTVTIEAPDKKTAVHQVTAEPRRSTVLAVDLEPLIPMTPAVPPPVAPPLKPRTGLQIAGIAATIVGGVGLAVGGVCHYKWQSFVNDANEYSTTVQTEIASREDNNDVLHDDLSDLYDKQAESRADAAPWKRGMVIAYALGGVVAAVGGGLLIYRAATKKGESPHGNLSIRPDGIAISF